MNFKLAQLHDANGDINHRWFVFYYFRDPDTGKWIRFRIWLSSKLVTRVHRYEKAKEIKKAIDLKLRQGFNPFLSQNRGLTTLVYRSLNNISNSF
jgi:hypothetical protein